MKALLQRFLALFKGNPTFRRFTDDEVESHARLAMQRMDLGYKDATWGVIHSTEMSNGGRVMCRVMELMHEEARKWSK